MLCLVAQSWLFVTQWTIAGQAPLFIGFFSILKWVAMPSSRGSSQPRDQTQVSHITGRFFIVWATRETPRFCGIYHQMFSRVVQEITGINHWVSCQNVTNMDGYWRQHLQLGKYSQWWNSSHQDWLGHGTHSSMGRGSGQSSSIPGSVVLPAKIGRSRMVLCDSWVLGTHTERSAASGMCALTALPGPAAA